jgi:hypothetical protein
MNIFMHFTPHPNAAGGIDQVNCTNHFGDSFHFIPFQSDLLFFPLSSVTPVEGTSAAGRMAETSAARR